MPIATIENLIVAVVTINTAIAITALVWWKLHLTSSELCFVANPYWQMVTNPFYHCNLRLLNVVLDYVEN